MTAAFAATDSESWTGPKRPKVEFGQLASGARKVGGSIIDGLIDPLRPNHLPQTLALIAGGTIGYALITGLGAMVAGFAAPALLAVLAAGVCAVTARSFVTNRLNKAKYQRDLDAADNDEDPVKAQELKDGLQKPKTFSEELFSKASLRNLTVAATGLAAVTLLSPVFMAMGLGFAASVAAGLGIAALGTGAGSLALDYAHAGASWLFNKISNNGKEVDWGKVHKQAFHNAYRTSLATISIGGIMGGIGVAVDAATDQGDYNAEKMNTSPTAVNPDMASTIDQGYEQESAANPNSDAEPTPPQNKVLEKFEKTKSGRGARVFLPGM